MKIIEIMLLVLFVVFLLYPEHMGKVVHDYVVQFEHGYSAP